nr:PEP-utilizing enzyme [uncultured Treponema sp.]
MGMNLSKPTIVGAPEATSILKTGDIITLNGKTGVVIKGTAALY